MPQLLNARKMRQEREVDVDLGDDTFIKAKREDMTSLVLEGRVPMPILAAVQKMIEMPNASPMQRIQALGDSGRSLLDLLRNHACDVSIDPKIVMDDDGNPDHLPVALLDTQKLMAIWVATSVVPEVSAVQAATFRQRPDPVDADDVPVGSSLPPRTIRVDSPEHEFISG